MSAIHRQSVAGKCLIPNRSNRRPARFPLKRFAVPPCVRGQSRDLISSRVLMIGQSSNEYPSSPNCYFFLSFTAPALTLAAFRFLSVNEFSRTVTMVWYTVVVSLLWLCLGPRKQIRFHHFSVKFGVTLVSRVSGGLCVCVCTRAHTHVHTWRRSKLSAAICVWNVGAVFSVEPVSSKHTHTCGRFATFTSGCPIIIFHTTERDLKICFTVCLKAPKQPNSF